jgi:Sulfotransferase family
VRRTARAGAVYAAAMRQMRRPRSLAKQAINRALRARGYELRRAGSRRRLAGQDVRERLVTAPAFILCTVRSGSTLLRVLLDSHSRIHSPSELHLRDLAVESRSEYSDRALKAIGLELQDLQYLLWDRLLHRELLASGKEIVVNKTPSDVFIADRIVECWPDARFIFLLRHPAAIAASRQAVRPNDSPTRNAQMVLRYGEALEQARRRYPGLTVRYEELTADPRAVTAEVCDFLGVPWEAGMLEYGRFEHGGYRAGLGDWKEKIRSGQIQAATPPPDDVPPQLVDLSVAWGYAGRRSAG